jgi:hypothetical protein
MSKFDAWMSGLGVDVEALKAKAGHVADDAARRIKTDVNKAEAWVKTETGEAIDAARRGVEQVKQEAGAVVDAGKKGADQAKKVAATAADAAAKGFDAAKVKALGDRSGKPVPRKMDSDCEPVSGYMAGPANHRLCAKHGHVVDTRSHMIIANSVAAYAAQALSAAAPAVANDVQAAGKSGASTPTSFPGDIDPPGDASPNDVLSKTAGTEVKIDDIRASVTIPAGQVLDDSTENVVSTVTDAHINVSITANQIVADFEPFLSIGSGHWFAKDIKLQQVAFDWNKQQFSADWNTSMVTNVLGNVGDKILAKLEATLRAALPPRMFTRGYSPFRDEALAKDLPGIANKLFPKSSGGGKSVKTTNASLMADFSLGAELRREPISIASGTRVSLTCSLQDGVPSSGSDLKISSLHMTFSGPSPFANVNFKMMGQELPVVMVRGVTFASGGKLSMDYDVIDESIANLVLLILAQAAHEQGQVVHGELVKEGVLRGLVEQELKTKIEPLLRQVVLDNRNAIDGIDLAKSLSIN